MERQGCPAPINALVTPATWAAPLAPTARPEVEISGQEVVARPESTRMILRSQSRESRSAPSKMIVCVDIHAEGFGDASRPERDR